MSRFLLPQACTSVSPQQSLEKGQIMGGFSALKPGFPVIAWKNGTLPAVAQVRPAGRHPAWLLADFRSPHHAGQGERAPLTIDQKIAQLKAVLFLAKEPLSNRKLAQYANLADGTEARTLVTRLNRDLDRDGRAFRVETVAGGYLMVTRPQFSKWLRRLEYVPGATRLSAPAMETLAVVAYRQPVQRAEVEAIRGVGCGEMLGQLLGRDLIRISGRSDDLGRPYLYSTTKRFLLTFGLRSLDELPNNQYT
jgi:segregation and condensation protein B